MTCSCPPGYADPECPVHGERAKLRTRIATERKSAAGHTADCEMNGCESIPKCQVERKLVQLGADLEQKLSELFRKSDAKISAKLEELLRR